MVDNCKKGIKNIAVIIWKTQICDRADTFFLRGEVTLWETVFNLRKGQ